MNSFLSWLLMRLYGDCRDAADAQLQPHQAEVTPLEPCQADAPQDSPVQQQPHDHAPMHTPQHRRFAAAALSQPDLRPAEAVSLCLVHIDQKVNVMTLMLQQDLHRLVDASALGLIAEAARRSGVAITDVTAEQVQAGLQAIRDEVNQEIATAREERAAHEATFRDAFGPTQRLRNAVAQKAAAAGTEATVLRAKVAALNSYRPGESPNNRSNVLRNLLSPKEFAAIGVPDSEAAMADMNARIAALDALVTACARFNADTRFSVHHLQSLGFDAEIEEFRAAQEVHPA